MAGGVVRRVIRGQGTEEPRTLWLDLARRLVTAKKEGAFELNVCERKLLEYLAGKVPAPPP